MPIQMKAVLQYFPGYCAVLIHVYEEVVTSEYVVLFIVSHKVVLTFEPSLVKIFGGSLKIFKDPPRSAKICKGLLKILEDKDLLKILTDLRGFLEDPVKIS